MVAFPYRSDTRGELSSLRKSQGWKVVEKVISNLAVLGNSEDETFGACGLDFDRESASEGDGVALLTRLEIFNLFGGKHGVEVFPDD